MSRRPSLLMSATAAVSLEPPSSIWMRNGMSGGRGAATGRGETRATMATTSTSGAFRASRVTFMWNEGPDPTGTLGGAGAAGNYTRKIQTKPVRRREHAEGTGVPASPLLLAAGRRRVDTETVQRAVVGAEIDAAVGDADAGEVIELVDLIAARPQFLAGERVEDVDRRPRPLGGADRRIELQADIRPRLLRLLAAAIADHHAVDDEHGLAPAHVARYPPRRELELAAALDQLEGGDTAFLHGTIRDRKSRLRMHRSPEGGQHPARAGRILPRAQRPPAAHVLEVHFLVAE